jgi:hypothetical protein
MKKYILDENNEPVPIEDTTRWGRWMEENEDKCLVGEDSVASGWRVNTRFMGMALPMPMLFDSTDENTKPVLWETMAFGGPMDGDQIRYTSHRDAVRGHATALECLRRHTVEGKLDEH